MSTFIKKDVACPNCGATKKFTIISAVNAAENPELKEKILNESFFDNECPECGYRSMLMYPLVYHDPDRGYMIGLYRSGTKGSKVEAPASLKNIVKRRVKDLSELKEKILILDSGLDDVAVEMVKNALMSVVRKSYGNSNVKAYFSKLDGDGNPEFAIFFGGEKKPQYHSTKREVYESCSEILRSLNYKENPDEFLRVGPTLAEELVNRYKNS